MGIHLENDPDSIWLCSCGLKIRDLGFQKSEVTGRYRIPATRQCHYDRSIGARARGDRICITLEDHLAVGNYGSRRIDDGNPGL